MSWPALDQLIKGSDVSCYQNPRNSYADRDQHRIDFAELASRHPEVLVLIARVAGSWSGVDPDFHHNYTDAVSAGFHAAPYVNVNPKKSIDQMMADWWKPQIDAATGGQDPPLIVVDAETNGWYSSADHQWHDKVSADACTSHVQGVLAALAEEWPEAVIWIYTAAWWWDPNIVHGWEGAFLFWLAHYPYFHQDSAGNWVKAVGFAEVDRVLPIDNGFTPKLPKGVALANTVGWQFTDTGSLDPIETSADLDYFKRTAVDQAFGSQPGSGGGGTGGSSPADLSREIQDLRTAASSITATATSIENKTSGGS